MLSKLSDSRDFKFKSITTVKGATKGITQTVTLGKDIYMWLVFFNYYNKSGGWSKSFSINVSGSYKWKTPQYLFGQSNNHWGISTYHAYAFILIKGDGSSCTINAFDSSSSLTNWCWYQLWRFNE